MRYESVTFACDNNTTGDDCAAERTFPTSIAEHVMGMTLSREGWTFGGRFEPQHFCPEHAKDVS